MKGISQLFFAVLITCSLGSCVTYDSLVNFNEAPGIPDQPQSITNYEPIVIQPNDILEIQINSANAASVQPFRTNSSSEGGNGFLVNSEGNITFPTLGKIPMKGLAVEAAADTLLKLLDPYFEQEPIVSVRLANFRINVNGEVNNPGIFPVQNERVTILDALSLAGDFTSFSRRDSIMVIRERDGVRTFGHLDLNSTDVFNSPYFYLQQNDVVYVRPAKTKTNAVRDPATRVIPWISVIASLTVVAISIIRL
ncbi:polysaccharide biosynthesis/export family protein [Flavilitoribacter nigricans]|nr:polysaccharide biosynthesis/export family protein [Flavilitoribacter nigricans]